VQYRILGRTGLQVSVVGLGAWEIGGAVQLTFEKLGSISHGWGKTDDAESLRLLARCREAGVNFVDTAPIYGDGHSEEIIGRALRGCRDQWVVCTKGGHGATNGVAWSDFSKARLLSQIDESLRRLQMSHVDVYLLHGPSREDVKRGECLEALRVIREQGKARFVGVSLGPNDLGVDLIRMGVVDVFQQSISLVNVVATADLLPAAVKGNVGIVARGVMGAGFLTGCVSADTAFNADDRRSWQSVEQKRALSEKSQRLRRFAVQGRSLAQLAIQFVLGLEGVTTVIPGTTKWSHMAENIAVGDAPPLTDTEMAEIRAALA